MKKRKGKRKGKKREGKERRKEWKADRGGKIYIKLRSKNIGERDKSESK